MSCDHLSEFLNLLSDRDDLTRISVPVDPFQELGAICLEVVRHDGPALLFDNVLGSRFPVVVNLLGSERRLHWALGVSSYLEVADRIRNVLRPNLPQGWYEALQLMPRLAEVAKWPPRIVEVAVAQQVVQMGRDINLATFPFLRSWPLESLPVLHAGQVIVEYPSAAEPPVANLENSEELASRSDEVEPPIRRLVSRVPVQVRDSSSCYLHWTPQSREWALLETYRAIGRQMPVAVAIGGDPLLTFAADAPLPTHVDPFVFAGFLRRQPVDLTQARSINLRVPANAELILEGTIDPLQDFESAPRIGLPTGYYSEPQRLPVMHLTAVTHRSSPVIPSIVATSPPSELDTYSRAANTMFLPVVQLAIPELVALERPSAGAFRHIVFASIRKSYPQQARKVMNAIWGLDRLATSKLIVVVDADVDISHDDAVWFAVASHAHPSRDILFSDGPADMLDHATPIRGIGGRMGIDATRKLIDEGHGREWPEPLRFSDDVLHKLKARGPNLGLDRPFS